MPFAFHSHDWQFDTAYAGPERRCEQWFIRLLSLKQSRSGTARISYAKLGIGQLGAVYETLISFTGVVAKEDLIELRPKTGRGTSNSGEENESAEEQDQEDAEAIDSDDEMAATFGP